MIISALKESQQETRVSLTPNAVKNLVKRGFEVVCETNAGLAAGFNDEAYLEAGALIEKDRSTILKKTHLLITLNEPTIDFIEDLNEGALLISPIDTPSPSELLTWCCKHKISVFSMSHVPRITRAQNIDVLSSQANLAGYRSVLEALNHYDRVVPMMMTAAGMIKPAKILVLGAGVAGLQAIATAKRLGAVVYAFDVRTAAKEQVESLGAEFIEVSNHETTETAGGYAKEVSTDYQKQQARLIDEFARLVDIIISTALIPGKKAPILLPKDTVLQMKPGSIIVDLATSRGGNCELSVADDIVTHHQITIIGCNHLARKVPATASELYANNVVNLIQLLGTTPEAQNFDEQDDIIKQAMLCHDGRELPFQNSMEQKHA